MTDDRKDVEIRRKPMTGPENREDLQIKERTCRHCRDTYEGTAYGLCTGCGRFQ